MKACPVLRQARADGWTITPTRGGHLRLDHPEATGPVFASATASDHRAVANLEGDLRRALPAAETRAKPSGPKKRRRRRPPCGYQHPTAGERMAGILAQCQRRLEQ